MRDEKILIVEDNQVIAQALEDAGVHLRYQCDRVSDGWDAIGKLETEDYAAIVIDADVPRHSGFGVLNYLREEVGEDLDNVIFMTSSNHDEVRRNFGPQMRVVAKDDAIAEITRVITLGRA